MIHHIPITEFDPGEAFEVPVEDRERQERDEAIVNWFENVFHILNAYQSHQRSAKQLRMSTRAMELALGFRLAAGADGPAQLGRQCGVDKQTMGKCMNHFIAQLKLSPLPFQRRAEARAAMQAARYNQIGVERIKCKLCKSQFVTQKSTDTICPMCAEQLRKESVEKKSRPKKFEEDKFRKPTIYDAKMDYEGPGHQSGQKKPL